MPPIPPQSNNDGALREISTNSTPPKKSGNAGATVGIIIIVILMLFGALYFWGASLNTNDEQTPLPLIPEYTTTQ